jgi:cell division septation protein DedD
MQDEGLHEIQLSGKQLVFLFMAVTVAAVVVFLCGVMVGRGVTPPGIPTAPEIAEETPHDPTQLPQSPAAPPVEGTGGGEAKPDELTYPRSLTDGNSQPDTLKPPSDVPASTLQEVAPLPSAPVAEKPTPATAKASVPDATLMEPPGRGYVVQVAAVRRRAEAETIARRLNAKGYRTFVTTSGDNFRIRVGKYGERSAAEAIARQLEREERFKPWITQ